MSIPNIEEFLCTDTDENNDNFFKFTEKALKKLNSTRKKLLIKGVISELIIFLVLIVTIVCSYNIAVVFVSKLCIYIFAIFLILFLSNPMLVIDGYRQKVLITKRDIFKNLKNIKYQHEKELFSNDEIYKSKLFGYYEKILPFWADKYTGEPIKIDDTFCGEYRNISFKIEEIQIYKSFPLLFGRGISYFPFIKLFKGVVIVFKLNKAIKANTIIATKKDLFLKNSYMLYALKVFLFFLVLLFINFLCFLCIVYNKYAIIGIAMIITIPLLLSALFSMIKCLINMVNGDAKQDKKLYKLTFEDPIWEKKYNAYSEDLLEGKNLLTNDLREKLLNLTTAFGSNKAKCSFYDNKLMIAISANNNLFEFGNIFTTPKSDKIFTEFISILYLIEYFKL